MAFGSAAPEIIINVVATIQAQVKFRSHLSMECFQRSITLYYMETNHLLSDTHIYTGIGVKTAIVTRCLPLLRDNPVNKPTLVFRPFSDLE